MKFQRFYEDELQMRGYFENFQDNARTNPQIPASHIGRSIIYMPSLRLESILELDQRARFAYFRNLIGSKRPMVTSDSTVQRGLPEFDLESIYTIEKVLYHRVVKQGLGKLQVNGQKKLKVAIVDGSGFGHYFSSVVSLGAFPLSSNPYKTKGKELPASRNLLSRLTKHLGKSWCDILVGDGLYMTRQDFREAKEKYGCDLLVKTSEESLDVVKDAKGLFCGNLHIPKMETAQGIDSAGKVSYKIKALAGFEWDGLSYPLKVAWVREEKLKPRPDENPIEEFYVITTKEDLSAEEMRQIAHYRWQIENNVFKRLNSLIKSKNVHTHNFSTFNILLHLWVMGLCLLQIFNIAYIKDKQWTQDKVRKTWKLFLKRIELSLLDEVSQQSSSP